MTPETSIRGDCTGVFLVEQINQKHVYGPDLTINMFHANQTHKKTQPLSVLMGMSTLLNCVTYILVYTTF